MHLEGAIKKEKEEVENGKKSDIKYLMLNVKNDMDD